MMSARAIPACPIACLLLLRGYIQVSIVDPLVLIAMKMSDLGARMK